MADYFFKIFTSLRNCNVACSPALRLGGASEQLSGLCLQKVHSLLFKLGLDHKINFYYAKIGAVSTEPLGSFGHDLCSCCLGSWGRLGFFYVAKLYILSKMEKKYSPPSSLSGIWRNVMNERRETELGVR